MLYRSMDGKEEEVLWNSRDGVTPFIILSKKGTPLCHVNWNQDKKRKNHKLKKGDRYFADLTKERALVLASSVVNNFWSHPPFRDTYKGLEKNEVIFILAKEYYGEGHNPTILKHGSDTISYIPIAYRKLPKSSQDH